VKGCGLGRLLVWLERCCVFVQDFLHVPCIKPLAHCAPCFSSSIFVAAHTVTVWLQKDPQTQFPLTPYSPSQAPDWDTYIGSP